MRRLTPGAATAAVVIAGAIACAALLVLPGQTVVSVYVNDLFIFLDGAHRVASGQAPNRDFHTALGPLVYYLPALAYGLTGSLGLAMPGAMALCLVILAPPMAWVLSSRVRPVLAWPFAAFLLLVVAVPMNLGEAVSALSFAMFYNRVGWAALALLVVMALEPERPGRARTLLDAASAALLVALMIYSKISYGAVGAAFLVLLLVYPNHRRWAFLALALLALAAGLAEALWGGTRGYVADLRVAGGVSGGYGHRAREAVDAVMRNLADHVLFAVLVGWRLARARSWRDALVFAYCAAAGLVIMLQNSQAWGILTLHAGAVMAAEGLMRGARPAFEERPWAPGAGAPLLALGLVLPTIVHCAAALVLHAWLASERPVSRFALPGFERIRAVDLWPVTDYGFSVAFRTGLEDGARAIADLDPRRIVVLDFVNAFSAGLGVPPPQGDNSWLHWGRNVDHRYHVPPAELLADAGLVLVPKPGINGPPLWSVYGPQVEAWFDLVRETEHWRVYRRRAAPAVAGAG